MDAIEGMRMHLVLALLFTVAATLPAFAHGPMNCLAFKEPLLLSAPKIFSDSIGIREINIERMVVPASEKDPSFNEVRQTLLALLANTIFENGSIKGTLERGELSLGVPLGDGSSIEFEYRGDQRGSDMVLRLNRITIFKPNGQSISVDRNPVSDDGRTLIAKPITLIDHFKTDANGDRYLKEMKPLDAEGLGALANTHEFLGTALNENRAATPLRTIEAIRDLLSASDRQALVNFTAARQTVQIPVVIEGPLMKELQHWLRRLPWVSRGELREASAGGEFRSLSRRAIRRERWNYVWDKIIKKQSMKLPLVLPVLGLAGYVFAQLNTIDVENLRAWMPHSEAVDKMVEGSSTVTDRPEYRTVREVLDGLQAPAGEVQAFDTKVKSDINTTVQGRDPIRALQNMHDVLAKHEADELKAGSAPVHFPEKGATVSVGFSPNSKNGYTIIHYPRQEKVILIPVSNLSSLIPSAVVLNVKKSSYPGVYKALVDKLPKP